MSGGSASSVIAVIRSASERTFEACRAAIAAQVPAGAVEVVNERPFEMALRQCYRIAIDSGAEWLLTCDADVLPRPGGVEAILRAARQLPDTHIQVEGLVHDKLLGGYRHAGHRVYRVRDLHKALAAIPPAGTQIRPETWVVDRLSSEGHPSIQCDVIFGVHDHEQFYRDLYRKAFVQGQKFREWLPEVIPRWRALADEDSDYRVATRAYFDGFQSTELASLDATRYVARAESALTSLGLTEKPPLPEHPSQAAFGESLAARIVSAHPYASPLSRYQRVKNAYRRIGFIRTVPLVLGATLGLAGNGLRWLAMAGRRTGDPGAEPPI
jgi:hypothetical protein